MNIQNPLIQDMMIFEFMKEKLPHLEYTDGCGNNQKYPFYGRSWQQLMPVVEKIGLQRGVTISLPFGYCYIRLVSGERFSVCNPDKTWLECVYLTIVDYLIWYNGSLNEGHN